MTESTLPESAETAPNALPDYIRSLHRMYGPDDDRTDWWLRQYAQQHPDLGLKQYKRSGHVKSFDLTPELLGKLAPLYLASAVKWAENNMEKLEPNEDRNINGLLGSLACALPYADKQTQDGVIDFIQKYNGHASFGSDDQIVKPGFFTLAASAYALPDIPAGIRDNLFQTIIQPASDRLWVSVFSAESVGRSTPPAWYDVTEGFIFLMVNPQASDVLWITQNFVTLYANSIDNCSDEPLYSAFFLGEAHPSFILTLAPVVKDDLIPNIAGFSRDVIATVFSTLKSLSAQKADNALYAPFADHIIKFFRDTNLKTILGFASAFERSEFEDVKESPLATIHAAMPKDRQPELVGLIKAKIKASKKKLTPQVRLLLSWLGTLEGAGDGSALLAPTNGGGGGATPKLLLHHGFCRSM
jgi:hypothetical protein